MAFENELAYGMHLKAWVWITMSETMVDNVKVIRLFLLDVADELSKGEISFPTFMNATLKIRTALNKASINADELAKIVITEPLLAAKVVKLANSVAINPSGNVISDVKTAVVRIGFNSVRSLAIALAMEQLVQSKSLKGHERLGKAYWDHCVDVAAHCYVLAKRFTRINPHEAMFAGIVHNIGAFYLLSRLCSRTDLSIDEEDLVRLISEWQVSISHAILSALALPEEVTEAVGNQESAMEGESPTTLSEVLYTAVQLSNSHPAKDETPSNETMQRLASEMSGSEADRASLVTALVC